MRGQETASNICMKRTFTHLNSLKLEHTNMSKKKIIPSRNPLSISIQMLGRKCARHAPAQTQFKHWEHFIKTDIPSHTTSEQMVGSHGMTKTSTLRCICGRIQTARQVNNDVRMLSKIIRSTTSKNQWQSWRHWSTEITLTQMQVFCVHFSVGLLTCVDKLSYSRQKTWEMLKRNLQHNERLDILFPSLCSTFFWLLMHHVS